MYTGVTGNILTRFSSELPWEKGRRVGRTYPWRRHCDRRRWGGGLRLPSSPQISPRRRKPQKKKSEERLFNPGRSEPAGSSWRPSSFHAVSELDARPSRLATECRRLRLTGYSYRAAHQSIVGMSKYQSALQGRSRRPRGQAGSVSGSRYSPSQSFILCDYRCPRRH